MNAQTQEVLRKMRLAYLAKLPQKLQAMEALVHKLNQADDCTDSFESLYRAVHTLRGTAGTYGLQIITAICKPFEEYLATAQESGMACSHQLAGDCRKFIDILHEAITRLEAGKQSFAEIEARLDEFCGPVAGSPPGLHAS